MPFIEDISTTTPFNACKKGKKNDKLQQLTIRLIEIHDNQIQQGKL